MKNLNQREQAIKAGYLNVLRGSIIASALRSNGKWTPTKNPRKASVIHFVTPDGLSYKASPRYIENTFFEEGEIDE